MRILEDNMHKRHITFTSIGLAMLATTAIAQTSAPTAPAPSSSAPTASTSSAKAPDQNLAGQGKWRASKLMGVDIYGPDDKKVGDITEVLFDKTGKIEMVTVGVGGFLGIGAKDVAIPFEQVTWSDQPIAAAAPAPAPAPSGGSGAGTSGGGIASTPTASAPKAPAMYPDHGKISMTKDQLHSAPAVTYSGS
ncbi:sporulation protein YlmC with PRC-barrel domain [Bosea sp. BE125]|uniref:PRC-barrel domain-containing protein n=1 Tax=Bosea sp. BE125 TaxID=2817909 RepID=UPI0028546572|nr:PRC-barrel domain-containing protein [Bosea sp. BE125]MDR6871675.1 sporulation protein YlmC with PRC-barrel domain [Bosea sp. BE125]